MITDKTVFILGAGASKPYGFPTAAELRRNIIYKFSDMFKRSLADHNAIDLSKIDLRKDFEKLISTFRYSSTKSIDLFLSRNKQFYEIGKRIITYLIANFEINSKFREDIEYPQFDWYMYLYDLLTDKISKTENLEALFKQNKVSFITFNYDRSLEHFLYQSLFNSFITERDKIKSLMKIIKITHVYGKIAYLPWEDEYPLLEYGSPDFFGQLEDFEKNIHIIFEERKDNIDQAKQLISDAQKIFFLGFGYADENLQALDFNRLIHQGSKIYGTGLGLTESERRKIESKLRGKKLEIVSERFTIDDCDSVMLLRKYL